MKLADIIKEYSFKDIYLIFCFHYGDGVSYFYNKAYQELLDTEPKDSNGIIDIEYVENETEPESYHHVYHTIHGERFGMDFVDWAEILGMELAAKNYTIEEAIAHILWEITFYGGSNAEVQAEGNKLLGENRE